MSARIAPLDAFAVPLGGTVLVEASAGTGKTHTITSLVLRLVLEEAVRVRQILVVTFTEAATMELRDRVRRRLRSAVAALRGDAGIDDGELVALAARVPDRALALSRAEAALHELDLASICTIHSFCQSVLREHAFESGARYGVELMPDTAPLVREVADDYWAHRVYRLDVAAHRLATKAFSLGTARTLVTALARRPLDMPVLPASGAAAVDDRAVQRAWTAARDAWRRSGAEVRRLPGFGGLHQGTYKPARVEAACARLDAWFAEEDLGRAMAPDALSFFSPAQLAAKAKRGKSPPQHPTFALLAALGAALERLESELALSLRRGAVDWVRAELGRRKQALRVQGFEDLLFGVDAALGGPRADELRQRVGERYRVALIDEFQDTDPVQYRIFRSLFHERRSLLLVGDPKQSIYAFRGADVHAYTDAKGLAARAYTLDENRRSDPSVVRAVNTIFSRVKDPFMLDAIGFVAVKAHAPEDRIALPGGQRAFEVLFLRRDEEKGVTNKGDADKLVPRRIAAEIASFLRAGATIAGRPVRPGDVAVLTRTNAQARATQEELRRLLVPTTLQSEENVFASGEANEVEVLLRAMLEPARASFVRSALATVTAGETADGLAALDTDERLWERQSERFRAWSELWTEHGFVHAYRRMLTELGVEGRLLALVDGERRMTNLLHLGELLHGVASRERLGPTALVRWLGIARAEALSEHPPIATDASELRLESDAHAVQLLTIHKSKGLEFPIVYCPFLYDVRLPKVADDAIDFHDPDDGLRLKIDVLPSKACLSMQAKEREVRAEHQRLLYVALTRAKHRCSVVWGAIRGTKDSALAYTLHQSPERFEALDDDGLREDLAALARASGGAIGVRDLDAAPAAEPWADDERPAGKPLAARRYARTRVDTWFRVGSFSALAKRDVEPAVALDPDAVGRDHDEVDERAPVTAPPADDAPDLVPLRAFPRGAKAGTMIHEVFEEHDFASVDETLLRALVEQKLSAAGYEPAAHAAALVDAIRGITETPLDGAALTLGAIPRSRRIDELEFMLPVPPSGDALTARRLASCFAQHPGGAVPADYAARLGTLRFLPLRGFLKGFIDLVFEHEGRFYVVDYKSNHLGDRFADYDAPSMTRAMAHHDYFLQYHLYALAVHRWLGGRLRGYEHEKHFGGVYYLFVRGMSVREPGRGVFFDRPPRARLGALSRALGGAP